MKIFIVTLILLTFQAHTFSQTPSEDYLGSWYTLGSSHRLSEHFSLAPYGELRFYESSSNYNLVFASLRGNYHINKNSTFGLGYAFLNIDTIFEFDDAPNVKENRILEQYVYEQKIGRFSTQHRFRFEHRFLAFNDRDELQNRFRYCLSFKYNLCQKIFLVLSEEPFANFQDQVFHENRFYIGIGINILENTQIQIGYLKQHIRKSNLNRIQIGINFKTDFRKPKTILYQL